MKQQYCGRGEADEKISLAEYLWNKFVYYVCFGWVWQR